MRLDIEIRDIGGGMAVYRLGGEAVVDERPKGDIDDPSLLARVEKVTTRVEAALTGMCRCGATMRMVQPGVAAFDHEAGCVVVKEDA